MERMAEGRAPWVPSSVSNPDGSEGVSGARSVRQLCARRLGLKGPGVPGVPYLAVAQGTICTGIPIHASSCHR